jgi:anti-sigma factor RsiW
MRHGAARRRLPQLLDDTLPAPVERAVRAHVARCDACARRLAEFEACERLLVRLPSGVIPLAASAAGEQRLAGLARWAFEPPRRRLRAGPEIAALAVAAAAVACVVALSGTSRWVPDTETTGAAATQVAYVVPASWPGR